MIVILNGWPGVGKLTIATELIDMIDGKLLDNHSIYNVAFALTEFKSDAFYETVRSVRKIAYQRVLELPSTKPVVLTHADAEDSEWANECWDDAIALARARMSPLYVVVLDCDPDENARRIVHPERAAKRKLRDPDVHRGNVERRPLLCRGGDGLLRLNITSLSAKDAAFAISTWLSV